jgi:fucose permease
MMAGKNSRRGVAILVVYLAGIGQGACFVTFPALGNIFKNPGFHNFSNADFGSLFAPMIVLAILTSILAGPAARRWGLKAVLLAGLISYALSMGALASTQTILGADAFTYRLTLLAISGVGVGIGTTLTALNAYAAGLFSEKSEAALSALYGIMGLGMALSPLMVGVFIESGTWWAAPAVFAVFFFILSLAVLAVPLWVAPPPPDTGEGGVLSLIRGLPVRVWGYAGYIFLYGICETVFANWAVIFLHEEKGLSPQWAGFALSAYWAMLTAGRFLAAAISYWFPVRWLLAGMPALILVALFSLPGVEGHIASIAVFGLAGLASSACLPFAVSFAEGECPGTSGLVSGCMVSAVMLGIGAGSWGVGWIQEAGDFSFSAIYMGSGVFAAGMIVLAFLLARAPHAAVPESAGA